MVSHHLQELTKAFVPISSTPALDAELLLANVMGKDRNYVLSHPSETLSAEQLHRLEEMKLKRLRAYPIPYLTNQREFWGNDFYVDESVLIPRPETEHLIETAIQELAGIPPTYVLDVGTGSGCIAVSMAKEIPQHTYLATDVCPNALRTASLNAIKNRVGNNITFYEGNLLEPLFDPSAPLRNQHLLILANLPYADMDKYGYEPTPVPRELTEGIHYEPRHAVHGGPGGAVLIKNFLDQVKRYDISGSTIIMEIGYDQAAELTNYIKALFPNAHTKITKDLAGLDRILKVEI